MKTKCKRLSLAAVALTLPIAAAAIPITVPATSDIWLAGMPAGSTAAGGDVAPTHSPIQLSGLDFSLDGFLTFTNASGGASNTPGCPPSCSPIDGSTFFNHSGGAENGIADARIPINALVGVFLDDGQPDSSPAPAALNFQTLGLNFTSLAPLVKQVFFIGDGLTGGGIVQQFVIPADATRLFLGTMDGFGWFNNSGSIGIEVTQITDQTPPPQSGVPEPATLALLGAGLAVLGWQRRRSRRGV